MTEDVGPYLILEEPCGFFLFFFLLFFLKTFQFLAGLPSFSFTPLFHTRS